MDRKKIASKVMEKLGDSSVLELTDLYSKEAAQPEGWGWALEFVDNASKYIRWANKQEEKPDNFDNVVKFVKELKAFSTSKEFGEMNRTDPKDF